MIEPERLLSLVNDLAAFGATDLGGVDRPALSPDNLAARRFLVEGARAAGVDVSRDRIANFFFRLPGEHDNLAPIGTGSHIDSQPTGGKLDGAYGVCAGLELLRARGGAPTKRPLVVALWTNEEGSRFSPGSMGSAAFVDPQLHRDFTKTVDADGTSVAEALAEVDSLFGDVALVDSAGPFDAFYELHIEQGPVLEHEHFDIGAVTGVQGCRWLELASTGTAGHAGTTPPSMRDDPVRSIQHVVGEAYSRDSDDDLRVTVGRMAANPGSINTIASYATATVDLRHPDGMVLDDFESRLRAVAATMAPPVRVTKTLDLAPCHFPNAMVDLVSAGAAQLGLSSTRMLSGAFHDAVHLATHCRTGMIFVPSIGGVSHHPGEATSDGHLVAGARVLASVVTELANR